MHDELIVGENAKQGRGRGPPTDALINRWTLIVRTYMYIFHKEIKQEAHRP